MNLPVSYRRAGILLALTLVLATSSQLQARTSRQLTATERYVLDRVKAGLEANLEATKLEDRSLGPDFVADLIIGRYKTPELEQQGVKISHAILNEVLAISSETVPYAVWFKSCIFERGVDFEYARFGRDLSFEGSTFGKPPKTIPDTSSNSDSALFLGMKVDGPLNFDDATFYIPINLTYAEVASEFLFDGVHYESTKNADFESIKAKEPVFLRKDHFAGKIVLADAQLFELFIEDPLPPGTIDLDLTQARIEHELSIQNATLSSFTAPFFVDNGEATFDRVVPKGTVSLVHSHFKNLTITKFDGWLGAASLADGSGKAPLLNLEGLSFEGIDIPDEKVAPQASRMLDLIGSDRCPYSPQPYLELEKFLHDHGYPEQADDVYIAMHRRERKQLAVWKRPFDCLLDALVGYGRAPWRAILVALALAAIGTLLFRPHCMEPEDKSTDTWYNAFWYSLDLLSPIDLGISKKWRPSGSHRAVRGYAQIHRLLGWILIPLIVAAITGIIK